MVKQTPDSDDDSPHRKRQKLTTESVVEAEKPVRIQTSNDLHALLIFEQDTGPHVKQKIQSFKLFLESVAYGKESQERSANQAILLEYLNSQVIDQAKDSTTRAVDLVRTWHFANQTNVESLFSSIAAVLTLLLKTISTLIDFRDCGNHLCRFLLQDDQIKLFDRGLSASKAKEHLISPCLRLLTEIVLFDGGHSARAAFRQRDVAFKRLDVFLGMRRGGEAQNKKIPPIRNNALRYLYANLKLQEPAAKMYILAQGKLVRAVFEDILEDSPTVVCELLEVLKKDVASDTALSHSAKSRFFNEWALSRIANLYRYTQTDETAEGRPNVQRLTHDLLLFLCTFPGHGVLDTQEQRNTEIEDSIGKEDGLISKHTRLAIFLQGLRPHASVLQSELILAVFRTIPQMAPDYFARRKAFSFDPKATATWTGYSSFLLATVRLPLSRALLASEVDERATPHAHKLIDSVVPEPMSQKVMTRCLNQSTGLIKFITSKLLTAAFEKIAEVLRIYRGGHVHTDRNRDSERRDKAILEVTADFCSRIPDIDHVITQLRACSSENSLLRESLTRLLALYYVVVPQVALEANFDVSIALMATLQPEDSGTACQGKDGIRILELKNLLDIAERSPSMKWWHKTDKMSFSPFTTLLRLYVDRTQAIPDSLKLRTILASVIRENYILQLDDHMTSLDVLVVTLQPSNDWKASDKLFEFFDNCVLRLVRKPVHYYDGLSDLVARSDGSHKIVDAHVDLLLMAIVEQWPFMVKAADDLTITNVATWLTRYVELSWLRSRDIDKADRNGPSKNVLAHIRDQIKIGVNDEACCCVLDRALSNPPELGLSIELVKSAGIDENQVIQSPTAKEESHLPEAWVYQVPEGPPEEHEDHPELYRWTHEDTSDAIDDGAIGQLLLCLCSKYPEIRQQAMKNIGTFMVKLRASGISDWQQPYVVAGAVKETMENRPADSPLPYFAGVLAARFLLVIADSLHIMYEKVNKFLNKGPEWNVNKLPSYWVDKILLNPPTSDELHYQEAEWLLDALIDGLRTPADFDLYYNSRIYERLLSFSSSSLLPGSCAQKIVDLLFRSTYVDGSSILITRCGLISWITCRLALSRGQDEMEQSLRLLASTAYTTSNHERVDNWSHGTLSTAIANLQIHNP